MNTYRSATIAQRVLGRAGLFLAVAAILMLTVLAISTFGSAGANHDAIACDDDIPAGYTCVPLVNKPLSGPGVGTPAVGELFYKLDSADTMLVAIRALPSEGSVDNGADHQFCLDDDADPYSSAPANNGPGHCTGSGSAATNVDDGSGNIPPAANGESDGAGEYEVFNGRSLP